MLIATAGVDYIFHAAGTTPLHAQHIAMHEVGHLVLDHGADPEATVGRPERLSLAEQAVVQTLLPSLPPAVIRRVLGRTTYSDPIEREVELFASMLLVRAYRPV